MPTPDFVPLIPASLQANVGNEADVIAMFKTAVDTFGRLDVGINNWGENTSCSCV
jgi:NAD(P)-dependent dehydrogenase (short-subunit alcohol dehydrogenase family)